MDPSQVHKCRVHDGPSDTTRRWHHVFGRHLISLGHIISHPIAARCSTSLFVGTAESAAFAAHKRKITDYTTAYYDFPYGTLVPISFETGGYALPDTMAFFKRYIKYGMSDGTATEPV